MTEADHGSRRSCRSKPSPAWIVGGAAGEPGQYGGLLLKGQTLCVIEVVPAAYVMLAANEAEKAADITLVHYQPAGKFGRLYISGAGSPQFGWRAARRHRGQQPAGSGRGA